MSLAGSSAHIVTKGDKGARAMPELNRSFPIEFGISLYDGIGADYQRLSERANRRQLIARPEQTALDCVPDLVHQLDVDGHPARWIQSKRACVQCIRVMIQLYSRRRQGISCGVLFISMALHETTP